MQKVSKRWLAVLSLFSAVIAVPTVYADPTILEVISKPITVDGKKSQVFDIIQPDGTWGYTGVKGQTFDAIIENRTKVPLVIHWHGLVDPNKEDGVPYVTQLPIKPGKSQHYTFPFVQAGTFWMHSHYKLQEQKLMSAPLIIKDPNDPYADAKDVTVMFQDFSFRDPKAIFADLRKTLPPTMDSMPMPDNKAQPAKSEPMSMGKGPDLNDVKFDAYLANRRTLNNPEVVNVASNQTVRLRIINGSASSNFWIDTGDLKAKAIAFDGENIKPFKAKNNQFELGIGERIDLLVTVPSGEGAYPILAYPEGTKQQTGIILATSNATVPKLSELRDAVAPPVDTKQLAALKALNPLPEKKVDRVLSYVLGGNMKTYDWTMNGQLWPRITPKMVEEGERVEIDFINQTGMTHPMHMHGHVFEVVGINDQTITDGAMGDTFLVPAKSTVKLVFDANNPGIWMAHCHVLYHVDGGMMTTFNYVGYPEPSYYKKLISGQGEAKA